MLADDLTGACDAAVAFAQRGFRTAVLPAGVSDGLATGSAGFEMTVLPTFSREDAPAAARSKVEAACEALSRGGIRLIYKKIDSTLKGNLAAEIDAVLACGGFSSAVVSPAFPAMGRTVATGVLQVGGKASLLHIPSILASVPLARSKDAASDRDLRELAAEAVAGDGRVLCVGSGGLAAQLAALLAERFRRESAAYALPVRRGPALFVMGSEQQATRAQVDYLIRNRSTRGCCLAEVDPAMAATAFREGRHLVVTADPAKCNDGDAARLLALAAEHLAHGLVVSGGDTAEWISRAAQVTAIELQGEVLRGIPWGEAVTRSGQRWCMVTKAGGFGAADALAIAGDFLMRETSKRAS
jgi:uncharacterized protein YgbK (DUF1537 family)